MCKFRHEYISTHDWLPSLVSLLREFHPRGVQLEGKQNRSSRKNDNEQYGAYFDEMNIRMDRNCNDDQLNHIFLTTKTLLWRSGVSPLSLEISFASSEANMWSCSSAIIRVRVESRINMQKDVTRSSAVSCALLFIHLIFMVSKLPRSLRNKILEPFT